MIILNNGRLEYLTVNDSILFKINLRSLNSIEIASKFQISQQAHPSFLPEQPHQKDTAFHPFSPSHSIHRSVT